MIVKQPVCSQLEHKARIRAQKWDRSLAEKCLVLLTLALTSTISALSTNLQKGGKVVLVSVHYKYGHMYFVPKLIKSKACLTLDPWTHLLKVLLQGSQVLTGLAELTLLHTLTDVPTQDRISKNFVSSHSTHEDKKHLRVAGHEALVLIFKTFTTAIMVYSV
uniref:Uncharacterized protein n=1 Tax=Dunaliella tertiolecta TaxID=3047 RepID=A0A7S3VST1_DUNTE